MILFLFASVLAADKTLSLPNTNALTTYCSSIEGEIVEFFTPVGSAKFLMTIVGLSENVFCYVYKNLLDEGEIIDPSTENAFIFPNSTAKLQFNFVSSGCVSIASTEFTDEQCASGIDVVTSLQTDKFYHSKPDTDTCIFFASASDSTYFTVNETNLGNDNLIAYKTSLSGNHFIMIGETTEYTSPINRQPWLFRLKTAKTQSNYNESMPKGVHLYFFSKGGKSYANEHLSLPQKLDYEAQNQTKKSLSLPIFGSLSPLFLIVAFIYALVRLIRKPAVQQKSSCSQLEKVVSESSIQAE